MINNMSLFFFKYLLLTPLYGWAAMYGVIGISDAIHSPLEQMNKKLLWSMLTIFFLSVPILFWTGSAGTPLFEIARQILTSIIAGALWSWIFLKCIDAIGFKFDKPKVGSMVVIFSAVAYGLFLVLS